MPASSCLLDGPEGPLDVTGLLGGPMLSTLQPHSPALSPLAPGWGPCADPGPGSSPAFSGTGDVLAQLGDT